MTSGLVLIEALALDAPPFDHETDGLVVHMRGCIQRKIHAFLCITHVPWQRWWARINEEKEVTSNIFFYIFSREGNKKSLEVKATPFTSL